MKTEIRTAIILAGVIVVGVATLSVVFSTLESSNPQLLTNNEGDQAQLIDKSGLKKAPAIVGIADYINTTPEQLEKAMQDKVVLYDIWTYSCINCVRTLPYITSWDEKYSEQGLLIIGVHSPEFEFEKDVNNVQMAVEKHGIDYPVVLDNDWETWKAFENRYWPHKFIADHEGYIRYDHIGEGGYEETEQMIQQLLAERANQLGINVAAAESLVDIQEFEHTSFRTPELYFGYEFVTGRNQLGNNEGFSPRNDVEYTIPNNLDQNYFYLEGVWTNLEGSIRLVSESGKVIVPYFAKEVNIVSANEAELSIYIDGNLIDSDIAGSKISSNGKLLLTEDGLYNIVSSEESESHVLEIRVSNPGFEIYTLTFG